MSQPDFRLCVSVPLWWFFRVRLYEPQRHRDTEVVLSVKSFILLVQLRIKRALVQCLMNGLDDLRF